MVDRRDEIERAEDDRMEGVMSVAHVQGSGAHHVGPWTLEQVLALPEDRSHRTELIGGSLLMSPNPAPPHQTAARRLANALESAVAAAGAPLVVWDAVNVVMPYGMLIPDLVVVDLAAAEEVFDSGAATVSSEAVSVVVEVASPSNRRADVVMKSKLYAEAGIPWYWRLDLRPAPSLTVGELVAGTYVERLVVPSGQTATWQEPFPMSLDPGSLTNLRI
ncbi:Uma2 family endonuclease [Streptodolium elevatio]